MATRLAIAATDASKAEGNSGSTPFTFTVTRSGNTTGASSATYTVTGSGANAADAADFTGAVLPTGTVSFAAGETSKLVTINVAGDPTAEANEGFTVTLSAPSAGTTITTAAATGTIVNDDASPSLAIAATDASKAEGNSGSTPFTFTVTRSGDTTGASSATYTVAGSGANAADAADFTGAVLPTGTVSFAAGETSKLVTINVAGDPTAEANEGFTVTLSAPSAGTTITTAAATGTIVNDDASLAIAATDASKAEGNSGSTPFTFTVTRSGDTTGASSATYTVAGSGANAADAADFTGAVLPTGTVSFAAGETSKLVTINVAGDTTAEANEGFTVTLSAPSAGTTITTAAATGTIVNDDSAPSLAIAATDASKAEGNSGSTPFTFTVTRSGDTTGASSATYTVTGSGANAADAADFTGAVLPTGTVSFAAGETSKLVTINVAGDTTAEANEGFTVTLSAPSAGTTITTAAATGTIVNDDSAPSLAIAATDASKAEGNSGSTPFTFTVTRSGDTTGASSATYTVAGSGANAADAADFTGAVLPTGTVSFAAGETSKLVTINVAGDPTAEANEGFTVTLSAPSAGTTITTAAATGTIVNDEAPVETLVKAINVGGQQFTAANGITYLADPGPTTGVTSAFSTSANIVGTTDDPLYNTERWTSGGSYTYEIPVANGTYRVELNFAEIYSGITGAGQRVFDMSLENQPLSSLQNIDIYGQVGPNAPYVIDQLITVADGSLSIQVGPGSNSPGNVQNAKLNAFSVFSEGGASASPSLAIAATDASKAEGNSGSTPFTFTVTRSGDTTGASSATYTVTGSGANAADAADFTGAVLPTGTVSFAAGETSKLVTINVAGDTTAEANEGFTVTLSAPSAGTTITTAAATGTIVNDDSAPSLAIAATDASKAEGNSGSTPFTFTVTRSGDTTGASSATYTVTGSGANAADAADFTGAALPTGTVSFAAGETSKLVTINVAGDTTAEANEGFTVTLSAPSAGTTITTAAATGTIVNNDASGSFSSQEVIGGIANPTSLQFGPDGRLYVSQQDGIIQVYTITQPTPGTWAATPSETINLIQAIPNHNDDGSLNTLVTDRQVTGILVTGTAANPVLYVTSSDPRIAVGGDSGLDTNSGILSQLTWTDTAWKKVDLIRGLPRSEENHSPNGLALSADGTKLYLVDGGNTNNGAPSSYFSNTSEYALSSAVLEIDLVALNAIPDKSFTYSPGVISTYKYDLPTLDDPTVLNDGLPGHETAAGLDVSGPFGGNNGLNQAILPADAPLRIFATGFRNAYDVVVTQAGKIFTIDNGSNDGLGGTPILDAAGMPTNVINEGGVGDNDTLNMLVDGAYYGHPVPNRANPTGSVIDYQHNITLANAASAVPTSAGVAAGFLIDPSKFTADAARLALEGQYGAGTGPLAQFFSSTNGLTEYTAVGEMMGDLITASFDGTIRRIDLASDGATVLNVTTLATPGGVPLDVTQGPDGSLWVTQIGSGQVLALTPSSTNTTFDPDIDGDGILNVADPFQYDSSNGTTTILSGNGNLVWNFQFGAGNTTPGPSGVFLGLTGHMQNGTRDFLAPVAEGGLDLNNVKIGTAAGGGLVVVEQVSNGTAAGAANTGEYLFQTGIDVAPNVETFNIKWTAINPFPGLIGIHDGQQIGGFIGTGDQDNFLELAVGPNGTNEVLFELESNGVTIASQALNEDGLLTAAANSSLVLNLAINRATAQATPSVTYAGTNGPTTLTGTPISLAGTSILSAIDGQYTVQGQLSGLAVGLWSTNAGEGSQNTFQAAFDDIQVTSTGPAETLVKAINVGGQQFTAANGITYLADPGPTTGVTSAFATSANIVGTTDDPLYNTERWTSGGSYTYEIPVANGTYRVELNFAEIYSGITGAGQRVFDMSLENQPLSSLQNIDIYGQVGPNAPFVIDQLITVADGSLSIQVGPGSDSPGNVQNAKLNAFSVFSESGASASPSLAIAATDASKAEGNSGSTPFTFTVTRSGDTTGASSATYTVTGSGANAADAADFTGAVLPTGTVSFAAGEISKLVTINVAGDTTAEANEGFTVTLSAPSAGTIITTAAATGTIVDDDSAAGGSATLQITPGGTLGASTYESPYILTNTGTTAITSFTIDLHNSLIAGIVFDPYGTFGDTLALDFTPDGSNPVTATWAFGPTVVTEGGYKTLTVNLDGAGLAPDQMFSFRVDVDPASINGPPDPTFNHAGAVSGFDHLGASVTVNYANGSSQTAEVFSDGSAGGGQAVIGTSLMPEVSLKISSADGTPLVTDQVGGIIKANLPGLDTIAGVAGTDVIVEVTGTPGQDVRLSVAEIGGVGLDIPLGSHEGNKVLQDPTFIDATISSSGTVSVPIALPAVTSTAGLEAGSVSGLFAVTAALVNTATGEATSLVSQTLVVKDAANSFTSEANVDTFHFKQGFVTTDIFNFTATGTNHDFIELDQNLFPDQNVEQLLASGALTAGAGVGDVNITTSSGAVIQLHGDNLTVATLQTHPEDFFLIH